MKQVLCGSRVLADLGRAGAHTSLDRWMFARRVVDCMGRGRNEGSTGADGWEARLRTRAR